MRTFHLLCLSCFVTLSAKLYADDAASWTLRHFDNENGLPQNSVNYIEMDDDGYLWMATEAGIVRYDGRKFRHFDSNNSALLRSRFMRLGKNSDGSIYCIDDLGNISYYNNELGFSTPEDLRYLVPATVAGMFNLDRAELEKLGPFTGSYRPRLSREYLYHAIGPDRGFMVMASSMPPGYTVIAGYISEGRVRWVDTLKDCHAYIHRSMADIDGKLCYISRNRDIVLVDSNGLHSRTRIPATVPWDKLRENTSFVSFFRQKQHLILDLGGNIYEAGLAGDGTFALQELVRATDIPDIRCVRYFPEQGLLAVGSSSKGLFLFNRQQLISSGEEGKGVYALTAYGDSGVLTNAGIFPYSRKVPGMSEILGRHSILRDRKGHYWYSTGTEIWHTDNKFRLLDRIPLTRRLMCMQEDEQGTVWMSGEKGELGCIENGTIRFYELDSTQGKGICSFIPAGNQTFWVVGSRLCMWVDVLHNRQRIYHEFDEVELRTIYRDKQGAIWLGSYGQGYFLLRNGRFMKMPEDEAHHLKIVNSFLEDRKGYIWMTTNNGLFQCAVNDLYHFATDTTKQVYHHYYGKESGLKSSEFNGGCTPSGLVLGNGRLAFPSMAGVVLFNPDSIKPELPTSGLFIEQVLLDGTAVSKDGLSNIPPSFKRLELTVSSPYFGSPNNLNIEYNIDGFDDRWYALGEHNRVVLNRLKYGHYKLRLRKEAGFGAGNYITATLPLFVAPFFYQTWWFRMLAAVCIISFLLLVVSVRYRYLVRQRNRLEAEVRDRTSALVYHTKLMEKLAVMIAHDLKSPLYFLSKVTGHLRNNIQKENLREIDRSSTEIKNTADQVYQFIEGFNLWASSFTEGFLITKAAFSLEQLLQELRLFFKEMLDANGNRLSIVSTAYYTVFTDRELLKVVLRNIIDNANKHTRDADIYISVSTTTENHISVTVTDTGDGMSRPVLQRIQDRIAQASTAASIERNSRLGYQMIIDFTARIGASLDVQSEAGEGTSVTIAGLKGNNNETNSGCDLAKEIISAD